MAAYFTVVQCVPDPIADERINVGVIVFGDGQIRSRFLQNWDRVARFVQGDIDYLREFADWVEQAAVQSATGPMTVPLPGFPVPPTLDDVGIRQMAEEWSNSIQLTPPQPSLERPDMLLLKMTETFLREPIGRVPTFRDRQYAARLAVGTVRGAVENRVGPTRARDIVRAEYQIGGRVVPNFRVDLAITNSRIHIASQALSFETHNMSDLNRQMRDAVYTLRDVGEFLQDVELNLVALPPKRDHRNYLAAANRFRELPAMCQRIGARLVPEEQVPEWAEQVARFVETEIVGTATRAAQG